MTSEQLEYQQIVMRNVTQLQAMIADLLEVTRLETGKLSVEAQAVTVVDVVTDVLATLRLTAQAKGVTLSSDLRPNLPSAYADRTRLRQILIILLDNAIKFTGEGGSVTVAAQVLRRDPSFLLFSVSDSGCGISPESAAKIFERLYQAAGSPPATRQGLGLGLYICKQLVTRHGGDIWVESTPGKGSTFSFTLPSFESTVKMLLAPFVTNERWPTETAALVIVSAGPAAGSSTEPTDEWVTTAAAVVHRCLLPDLDVLLPTVRGPGAWAHFNVVAFADEPGVMVLVRRIQRQLERHHADKPAGPITSVSYRMLTAGPPLGDRAAGDRVAVMAAMIGEAMKASAARDR